MGKGMRAGKRPKKSGGNMQQQMEQMQAVQAKMDEIQAEIDEMETEATAGGNAVKVKVNGKKQVVSVVIAEEVVDPDDVEMLQDLIMSATNEALRQMEEISANEMNKFTSSLGLPPGMM